MRIHSAPELPEHNHSIGYQPKRRCVSMHTGFSAPSTAENQTPESSGSITVAQPASKVRAMAAAIDNTADGRVKPGIRCAVAMPATPRERKKPQALTDTGDIPERESEAGSRASNTDSAASSRLQAAAELVRRKKALAKLEVEEMEIQVELAEVRSARGSQRSSARRHNPGDLSTDNLAFRSPETLQSKMLRLQDSTAQQSLLPFGLPAVPEMSGSDLVPRALP